MSRRITAALFVTALGSLTFVPSTLGAPAPVHLRYLGVPLLIPATWPVIDLDHHPGACVRFDRHVVYLGRPSASQRCPAFAVGRTEALLLQPVARGARVVGAGVTFRRGRALVTATWRRHPAAIRVVLDLRTLPAAAARTASAAPASALRTARPAAVTTGRGFDACATPSESTMRAWDSSPYRTVGIYLGGQNMACSQPNLTSRWVSDETAAGWHFIPTYVGLQAPGTSCGCATIDAGQAAGEGQAAAADAVAQARAVGIGAGNPIYFDMEAYGTGGSASRTALAFLSAWTGGLHSAGYRSGVYSSAASGISDLVGAVGSGSYTVPDDIWVADWNGQHSTDDNYVPSGDWSPHRRIHQYDGGANITYGGVTMNIDGDYVDGDTANAGSVIPDGTFVQVAGTTPLYRIAGGAPLPVTSWTPFGGPQPVRRVSAAQLAALNPVPLDGTFLVTSAGAAYRVAGGALFAVTNWSLFGGQQPGVMIDPADVTLAGSAGSHLNGAPAADTAVEGLPSMRYWRFGTGGRLASPARAGAVAIEDAALTPYAVMATPPPCVVPRLHWLSVRQARTVLRRAHCTVGVVHTPSHLRRGHLLRVHAQRPAPGELRPGGHTVNLALL